MITPYINFNTAIEDAHNMNSIWIAFWRGSDDQPIVSGAAGAPYESKVDCVSRNPGADGYARITVEACRLIIHEQQA